MTDRLRDGVVELSARYGQPVVLAGQAGHFQPYFCETAPTDYREATTTDAARYRDFAQSCESRGVLIARARLGHSALSHAHTEDDIDELLGCLEQALGEDQRRTA